MREKNIEILSFMYFVIITIMYGFWFTNFEITGLPYSMLLWSAFALATLSFLIDIYKSKEFIKLVLLAIISICVYISSHETIYILMVWSAIMAKNIGIKRSLTTIFIIRLIMFGIVIFSSFIGVLDIGEKIVSKGIYGTVVGYGLGYIHPNNLAQAVFYLATLFLCIKNKNTTNIDYIIIFFIDIVTYMITKSKTACILLALLLLILFVIKKNIEGDLYKIYSKICLSITILLPVFGTMLPLLILSADGKIKSIIYFWNGIFNQRFSNAAMMYLSFPLTLFGKIIDTDYLQKAFGYNVIDNGYIFALFNFGIIGFLVVIMLYFFTMKKLIKDKEYVYFSVITVVLCFAFMENILRAMFMNFCMVFWCVVISSDNNAAIQKSRIYER
ncbi:hypothetical protein [Streptococcus sp. UBA3373]|uniref:hypothetical protein n=1 Tax=Streptococcus sp. UBA3373 TaxID=1947562 RepID=UPI0025DB6C38|nr:hypothetical protein [Streptococcus sp. UBA3373]